MAVSWRQWPITNDGIGGVPGTIVPQAASSAGSTRGLNNNPTSCYFVYSQVTGNIWRASYTTVRPYVNTTVRPGDREACTGATPTYRNRCNRYWVWCKDPGIKVLGIVQLSYLNLKYGWLYVNTFYLGDDFDSEVKQSSLEITTF